MFSGSEHARGTSAPAPNVPRSQNTSGTVIVVSANADLRLHLEQALQELRWTVKTAASGAEAWLRQEELPAGALLLDDWLPDLTPREFAKQFLQQFPAVDVLSTEGTAYPGAIRAARRNELLIAIRSAQESAYPALGGTVAQECEPQFVASTTMQLPEVPVPLTFVLPQVLGNSPAMQELGRVVRLVAVHPATVLIQGETGTGKELIAHAVHRLSLRAGKPFVTLNCAAIPEHLLEAELFGHTRGAFTGAVTSRTGRIEAAHGGTLFLDEIGEMPLALQAKMLRFLECGEIQKIGENDTSHVDVRIVAATHQPLEQNAESGRFRLDLYHRLAVFPVEVPPLRERMQDLPMLAQHALDGFAQSLPQRALSPAAMEVLLQYHWPGNVRELMHVLQRAMILSSDSSEIGQEHIRIRTRTN